MLGLSGISVRHGELPREFRRPVSLSHAALHDRLNPSQYIFSYLAGGTGKPADRLVGSTEKPHNEHRTFGKRSVSGIQTVLLVHPCHR